MSVVPHLEGCVTDQKSVVPLLESGIADQKRVVTFRGMLGRLNSCKGELLARTGEANVKFAYLLEVRKYS